VCANDAHDAGQLLDDWRRINVAVTRARHKVRATTTTLV
jgi:superfamily I DNA and/or RNA helicase